MSKPLTSIQMGDILELIVQRYHESQEYEVERARRITQFSKGRYYSRKIDFFDCDLICISYEKPTAFVQVGTQTNLSGKKYKLLMHKWNLYPSGVCDVYLFGFKTKTLKNPARFTVFKLVTTSPGCKPFEKVNKLPCTFDFCFKAVEEFRKKKNVPIGSICDFFGWDKKEYSKHLKEIKTKRKNVR